MSGYSCSRHHDYTAGCPGCRTRAATAARRLARAKAYGTWQPHHDAEPVRQHIAALNSAGISRKHMARTIGVTHNTIRFIANGRTRHVTPYVANAILKLTTAAEPQPGHVHAAGTTRRIQALLAAGHDLTTQAGWYRTTRQQVSKWANGHTTLVTRHTANIVAAAASQHGLTPAADSRASHYARTVARRNGWAPLAAWDDIDDPNATPQTNHDDTPNILDEVKVLRACQGRGQTVYTDLTSDEQAAAITRLNGAGLNDGDIARTLRADHGAIGRRRIRMHLPARANTTSHPRSA